MYGIITYKVIGESLTPTPRGENMKKKYQITLKSTTNKYKPVSCIIENVQPNDENLLLNKTEKGKIINRGIQKICLQRTWGKRELIEYGYTRCVSRVFSQEVLDQTKKDNAANYERLKEEKYASGEWKRPSEKSKKNPKR